MSERNVYVCVNLHIQAPSTFVVDQREWRPRFLEGEVVMLERDEKTFVDRYTDGPLEITADLVRVCSVEQLERREEYRRLVGLISLGAVGKQAHQRALVEFGNAITDTVLERYPDDAVLAFRVKELVKRYAE